MFFMLIVTPDQNSIRMWTQNRVCSHVSFPCCSGLEHHVPQLVDVCAAAVGLSHLDPACQVLFTPAVLIERLEHLESLESVNVTGLVDAK